MARTRYRGQASDATDAQSTRLSENARGRCLALGLDTSSSRRFTAPTADAKAMRSSMESTRAARVRGSAGDCGWVIALT